MLYDDKILEDVYFLVKDANANLQISKENYNSEELNGNIIVDKTKNIIDTMQNKLTNLSNGIETQFSIDILNNISITGNLDKDVKKMICSLIDDMGVLTDEQKELAKKNPQALSYAYLVYMCHQQEAFNNTVLPCLNVPPFILNGGSNNDTSEEGIQEAVTKFIMAQIEQTPEVAEVLNGDYSIENIEAVRKQLELENISLKNQIYQYECLIKEHTYDYLDSLMKTNANYNAIASIQNILDLWFPDGVNNAPAIYYSAWNINWLSEIDQATPLENYSLINLLNFMYKNEGFRNYYSKEYGKELTKEDVVELFGISTDFNNENSLSVRCFLKMTDNQFNKYNYLYIMEGKNSAFDYLNAIEDGVNKQLGLEYAKEAFTGIDPEKELLALAKTFGIGVEDGLVGCINNIMTTFNANTTMTPTEYKAYYLSCLLACSLEVGEYSLEEFKTVYNTGELDISEEAYNELITKDKITVLDIQLANKQINQEEYLAYQELFSLPEYQEFFAKTNGDGSTPLTYAYQVGNGVGNMLPSMATSALFAGAGAANVGKATANLLLFLQSYGGNYKENVRSGNGQAISMIAASLNAGGEVASEYFLGRLVGLGKDKNILDLATDLTQYTYNYQIIGHHVLEVLKDVGGEVQEEILQDLGSNIINAIVLGEPLDISSMPENTKETAIITAFTTIILNAPTNTVNLGGDLYNFNANQITIDLGNDNVVTYSQREINKFYDPETKTFDYDAINGDIEQKSRKSRLLSTATTMLEKIKIMAAYNQLSNGKISQDIINTFKTPETKVEAIKVYLDYVFHNLKNPYDASDYYKYISESDKQKINFKIYLFNQIKRILSNDSVSYLFKNINLNYYNVNDNMINKIINICLKNDFNDLQSLTYMAFKLSSISLQNVSFSNLVTKCLQNDDTTILRQIENSIERISPSELEDQAIMKFIASNFSKNSTSSSSLSILCKLTNKLSSNDLKEKIIKSFPLSLDQIAYIALNTNDRQFIDKIFHEYIQNIDNYTNTTGTAKIMQSLYALKEYIPNMDVYTILRYGLNTKEIKSLVNISNKGLGEQFRKFQQFLSNYNYNPADRLNGLVCLFNLASFYDKYSNLSMQLINNPEILENNFNNFLYLLTNKNKLEINDISDFLNMQNIIDQDIARVINNEVITKDSYQELLNTVCKYLFNMDSSDIGRIRLKNLRNLNILDKILAKNLSVDERKVVETLKTYMSFLYETIESNAYFETRMYGNTNKLYEKLFKKFKIILEQIQTEEGRKKYQDIYKYCTFLEDYISQVLEIDANATLTDISSLPIELYNQEGGYYDLSNSEHAFYVHAINSQKIAGLVNPIFDGATFICVTGTSHQMRPSFYDEHLNDQIMILFDHVPKGSFIGGTPADASTNAGNNHNAYYIKDARSRHQNDEMLSLVSHSSFSEINIYRDNLKPAGILMKGDSPSPKEIRAAKTLGELLGLDKPLPIIKTQATNTAIENPKPIPSNVSEEIEILD